MDNPAYNPDDDKRPAIQPRTTRAAKGMPRILTDNAVEREATARNNARSARGSDNGKPTVGASIRERGSAGRVSHTTNTPLDGRGERSVVDGRFTCITVYLHLDSDSRRQFPRYTRIHGISAPPVDTVGGFPCAVDVAAIDGKRDPVTGEWVIGPKLRAFLDQPFVSHWEYRTTARVPQIGGGACAADTLSPKKAREVKQSPNGLRRYDLQPAHKAHDKPPVDVGTMGDKPNPLTLALRALMDAVNANVLPVEMAGQLVDLLKNGAIAPKTVIEQVTGLMSP